jgi:NhaA family Na+:H+ antiporter
MLAKKSYDARELRELRAWVDKHLGKRLELRDDADSRRFDQSLAMYLIPGIFMWYFMLQSGVHATLAGVLLAFAIPFRNGGELTPSYRLQHFLHKPVAFLIMPFFALTNTGILFTAGWTRELISTNSLGVFAGLVIGKPLGIVMASFLAIKSGISRLSGELSWGHIVGVGLLGGIGFTMSIFITLLAFENPMTIQSTKISILLSSLVAGLIGYLVLRRQKAGLPNGSDST